MKNVYFLYTCLLVISLVGCDLTSIEEPIIIGELDDEFKVALWERLSPQNRSLELIIETLEIEPCQNAQILTSVLQNGNDFRVGLLDIERPSDCLPGEGPATANINLGQFEPGVYNLDINLKNTVSNEGQIVFRNNTYQINMVSKNGIQIKRGTLHQVPTSYFWGYFAYEEGQNEETQAEVLNGLADHGALIKLEDGDYGYFRISNGVVSKVFDQPEDKEVLLFGFDMIGKDVDIQKEVNRLKDLLTEGMGLFVMNDNGKIY